MHIESVTFGPNLNVAASDFNSGGPGLPVDWLHLSPYPSSGIFLSRVSEAGQAADWGRSAARQRAAEHQRSDQRPHRQQPDPGRGMSAFTSIASSGGDIPGNSRYVQYRAEPGSRN